MKSFEVKYTEGYLVDTKTQKRIFLKRGGTFNILGDDHLFEEKDELQLQIKTLDRDLKLEELKKAHKGFILEKAADKGQLFVYRIGLSKLRNQNTRNEFHFNAILLEDLYFRSKDGVNWSLCDCMCETTKCIYGNVEMIEPVRGNSLNNLFSNMITFYFPMQRSTACNAFDYFYFAKDDERHTFLDKNWNGVKPLRFKREEIKHAYFMAKREMEKDQNKYK